MLIFDSQQCPFAKPVHRHNQLIKKMINHNASLDLYKKIKRDLYFFSVSDNKIATWLMMKSLQIKG
jgi:hypothetical protein